MGNSSSCHANGGIFIQTDQAFYIAGDTITGKVHVNVHDSFPANVLMLKIKGYEESFWQEQRTRTHTHQDQDGQERSHTETYYESFRGRNTFFSHRFPLYTWAGYSYMPAGQYTFPFQFKLMDSLPGTYHETGTQHGGDYKAVIKYKVKVEMNGSNNKKLKNKQELIVREPLKNIVSSQYGERLVKPSTWCCISQGQSHIKCHFERNCYVPGETARMLCDIDNSQCDLAIKSLSCTLNKRLRLVSNSGREHIISIPIQRRNFSGVGAHETAIDNNRRSVELNLQGTNGSGVQPSTRGRYVNCEYNLNITAHLEGCTCCSDNPEVTVPVAIVSPPPVNYGVIQQPDNWNPQVYDVKTFAFSSDCMYTKGVPQPPPPPGGSQYPQQNNSNYPPQNNMNYPPQNNMDYPPQNNSDYPPQNNNNYPPQQYNNNYPPPNMNNNNMYPPAMDNNNQYPPSNHPLN